MSAEVVIEEKQGYVEQMMNLSVPERAKLLLSTYKEAGFNITPIAYHHEGGIVPFDEPEKLPVKPYLELDGTLSDGRPVRVMQTRDLRVENMQRRIARSIIARRAMKESADTLGAREILDHFRFPEVLAFEAVTFTGTRKWAGSLLEERIEAAPLGTVHLADEDAYTEVDLELTAKLLKFYQDVGRLHDLTRGEDWHHTHISDGLNHRRQDSKYWMDFGDRLKVLEQEFDSDFVVRAYKLLISDELYQAFGEEREEDKVTVFGNLRPRFKGRGADGRIIIQTNAIERTAYSYMWANDYSMELSPRVGVLEQFDKFRRTSIEQNGTKRFFWHLVGSFVLGDAINIKEIRNERSTTSDNTARAAYLDKSLEKYHRELVNAVNGAEGWDIKEYSDLK